MNLPYHPIQLKCANELAHITKDFFVQFNDPTKNVIMKWVPIPVDLQKVLDNELSEYDLPASKNFLGFKRKNDFEFNTKYIHIDGYYEKNGFSLVEVSIIIPVENCEGTYMYWTDGEYKNEVVELPHLQYVRTKFEKPPTFVYPIEIVTTPYVTRVDVPHSATSQKNGNSRVTLTVRLQGNPSFDSVIEKLKNK